MQRMMRWRDDDRGATAVIVALVLVLLMGFAALAVDVGALWSDRKQLQNGADAGALAVAQACGRGECTGNPVGMSAMQAKAQTLAEANKFDGVADGSVVGYASGTPSVTVQTTATRTHWFAPVIGIDASDVSATATASWSGTPSSMSTVPITVSYCQFFWQNGFTSGFPTADTPVYIQMMSKPKDFPTVAGSQFPCAADNAAHNEAGGGFGWLVNSNCVATTSAGNWFEGDPGNDTACSGDELRAAFGTTPGRIVKVPLFDTTNGLNGANVDYRITGYAALKIGGYCFHPSAVMNPQGGCNGNSKHLWGTFVGYSDTSPFTDDGSAIDYGITTVSLID